MFHVVWSSVDKRNRLSVLGMALDVDVDGIIRGTDYHVLGMVLDVDGIIRATDYQF